MSDSVLSDGLSSIVAASYRADAVGTGRRVRVGHAEREQVAADLAAHCARGRLTFDEFDDRVAHAWAAKTADELEMLVDDLPRDRRRVAPGDPVRWREWLVDGRNLVMTTSPRVLIYVVMAFVALVILGAGALALLHGFGDGIHGVE